MPMNLTVSIALCTYNGERFLPEQLASYARQTRLPDEIVVCDDGSKDQTLAILEEWAKTVPFPVRIVRNERNLGYAQNFGKAVSLCTGDVIFLSDQDDVWEPEKIAKMTAVFEEEPEVNLVVSDGWIVDGSRRMKETILETTALMYYDEPNAFCIANPRPDDCYPQGCASAFRATLKEVFLPIPPYWAHDIWLQVIAHWLGKGKRIHEKLFTYRLHETNTTKYGAFETRTELWRSKRFIYHWNIAEQFWAWEKPLEEFRKRLVAFPEPERKHAERLLRQNERHFTNRSRIQRNLMIFGLLFPLEVVSGGGYFARLFPFRSMAFDVWTGIKNGLNPVKTFRQIIEIIQKITKKCS